MMSCRFIGVQRENPIMIDLTRYAFDPLRVTRPALRAPVWLGFGPMVGAAPGGGGITPSLAAALQPLPNATMPKPKPKPSLPQSENPIMIDSTRYRSPSADGVARRSHDV